MPSLRQEITKTFLRLTGRKSSADSAETVAHIPAREQKQFGYYNILERLGFGGMGQVYLAIDTRLDRKVALKFLPPELTSDQAMLHRLQQEARTASGLNHPNIVTIYEVSQIEGEHFIASEYIDGVTLREKMERGTIDPGTALDIAIQVASALMAAHAAGIVHRDLKPSNIMIRPDGYVKVIDFGIAKHIARSEGQASELSWTRPGSVIGTPDYMSPEQARGEKLDHRTDLWSLGVVLYEMLAQKLPFSGETENHVFVAILDKPVPPLPEVKALPVGVREIVRRALTKDPSKRYQAASEMLADLDRISQNSGLHSGIRPVVVRSGEIWRSLTIAGAIIAALVISLGVWWWGFGGSELVLGPNWFQFDSTSRVTFDGNVRLATISQNGKYLAYISGDRGEEVLRIRQLQDGSETRAAQAMGNCIGITFSPDSAYLYYVSKDPKDDIGRLYSFRLPEGIPSLLLEDIDGPITFSPDGREFAYVNRSEENGSSRESIIVAQVSDSRNGRPVVTLKGTQMKGEIAWSPRGDSIAAIVFPQHLNESTQPAVDLFTPQGRLERQYRTTEFRTLNSPVWLNRGSLLAFSGLPQGSKDMRLAQLLVSRGLFHEVPSAVSGFENISATRDGRTLAAVRLDERSSLWIADASNPDAAREVIPATEGIESLSWSGDDELVFPSARSGSVNLWRADEQGHIQPIPGAKPCVEDQPAAIPNRAEVIYTSNCGTGGDDFNLWSVNLQNGIRKQLTSGANYDYQPDASPDGNWIVYTSWPSTVLSIWKLPVAGGAPVRVSKQQARYPAVSPDGKWLAGQIREPYGPWRVAILSLADGSVRQEFPGLPVAKPVRWSADGAALDYIDSRGKTANIWRQWLRGGPPLQLTHITEDGITCFAWSRNGSRLAYIRARTGSDVVLFHRSSPR